MKDQDKTKEQLINELEEIRQKFAASEASLVKLKQQVNAGQESEAISEPEESPREGGALYKSLYSMMRLMCDNVPDLIWAKDMDGKFLFVNRAICENLLFATDVEEPIGRTDTFFANRERSTHPENPAWHTFGEICVSSDQVVKDTKKPERFHEFGNVKGEFIYLDVHKAPFWNEQGEMIGTVGCGRVVTKEKRLQDALRRKSDEQSLLLDNIGIQIWFLTNTDTCGGVNKAGAEFMGKPAQELEKKSVYEILTKEEADACVARNIKVFETKKPAHTEEWVKNGKGQRRLLAIVRTPKLDDTGNVEFIICSAEDITDRKQAEDALRKSKEDLEIKVLERTAELRKANELLQLELTDRKKMEDSLRSNEERFRSLIDQAADAIFVHDLDGRFLEVNRQACASLLYTRDELLFMSVTDIDPDVGPRGDSARFWSNLPATFEAEHKRKDGTTFPVEIRLGAIEYGDSKVVLAMARDLTDRKKAEEALRESEGRYRLLYETMREAFVSVDMRGRILETNPSYQEMLGYTEDELHKLTYMDLTPEKWHSFEANIVQEQILVNGHSEVYQKEYRKKDGAVFPVELRTCLIRDKAGNPSIMWSIARDISERKRAKEAIEAANRDWERTFNSLSDPIMVLAGKHKILRANKAMTVALGMTAREVLGKACFELVHGENEPPAFCPHSQLLADGKEHNVEVVEPCLGGICDIRVSPLIDQNGQITGSVHVTRDITERKRTEEIERETERFRAVADLAGGVAHNFNNLLQIVISNLELAVMNLEMGNHTGSKDALQNVLESSRFGAETVRRLQSFAGIRDQSRLSEKGAFDLSGIVRQALEMSKTWWKAIPEKQGINVSLDMQLQDGCMVRCEKAELFEVVVNLVRNAAEALPQGGGIYVKTHVEGDSVILKIRDTGIGISGQNLKRLFNPFFTTKAKAGSGLGLASSRRITEDCGGNILVESSEGKGTTFTIVLPLAQRPHEQPEAPTEVSGRPLTILVIEDTEAVSDALEVGLTMFGHVVLTASSGQLGMDIFKENPIDLVICDLGMPGMNGWEVGKRIMSTCEERHISKTPFILLTGWGGQKTEVRKIAESGVDAVVEKPINLENILKIIRDIGEGGPPSVSQ